MQHQSFVSPKFLTIVDTHIMDKGLPFIDQSHGMAFIGAFGIVFKPNGPFWQDIGGIELRLAPPRSLLMITPLVNMRVLHQSSS